MDNYRQIQDYGILRKKDGKEEELFVFGYLCKIYEDYDKSLYVDQGKHLIPWQGDETLKIDRYDCRGALSDLTPYLPKSEGFDRKAGLSNEEKRIEALCDQERYRALTVNEEEILHQDEELKRLQMAINAENSFNEVGFNYDNDGKNTEENTLKENNEEEDEEPFIPPYQLDVPVGMKIPKSKKHHEIIEKTAFFINDQGIQMEILLKMKQADNPQFNFLSFDNELHPYYRHMLNAIKNQRYKQTQPSAATETAQEMAQEENYLHPALASSTTSFTLPESAPKIPTINYKPSENCLYSALVSRIRESQNSRLDLVSIEDQKKMEHVSLENPIYDPSIGMNSSPVDQNGENCKSSDLLPLSALTKSARRRRIRKEKNKAAVASFKIYYAEEKIDVPVEESSSFDDRPNETPVTVTETEPIEEAPTLKPVPAPAPIIEVPSTEMQLVIDKMASYVAKNGRDFEDVVRAKGDPRFSFLDRVHVYNPYYNQKVQLYSQLENFNKLPGSEPSQTALSRMNATIKKSYFKSKQTKQPIPICFAIKKPKDQETLEIKSALSGEESEIEEPEEMNINTETDDETKIDEESSSISAPCSPFLSASDVDPITELVTEVTLPAKKMNDAMMEKWDQERIKAKLFTAAKEKLAAKAKEKDAQLQAERRKKAMEFINLLQKDNRTQTSDGTSTTTVSSTNGKIDEKDVITIPSDSSSTDTDSIISVPISGEEDDKTKNLKRKYREDNDSQEKTKKRHDHSNEKNKHRKSKHKSQTRSPSYSRHSHKKYNKDEKKRKKRKHHHHRSRSPSYRKTTHKTSYKHKRSKYSDDDSSSSSDSERY